MSRILGFAPIDGADPATTFVASDAAVMCGDDHVGSCMAVVHRHGVVAACFVGSGEAVVTRRADRGELAATAEVDERSGLKIVRAIYLHGTHFGPATVWVAGGAKELIPENCAPWVGRVEVSLMQRGRTAPMAMPPDARPAGDGTVTIHLNGEIGDEKAGRVIAKIDRCAGRTIDFRIDSIGGAAVPARAIYDRLCAHDALVTTHVDRQAHSAAALVFLAGDHRTIAVDGVVMIHECEYTPAPTERLTFDAMLKSAERLIMFNHAYAAVIAARTGMDLGVVTALMHEETTFTAGDAYRCGFVHQIVSHAPPAAPTARKVAVRGINGPFTSFIPAIAQRAPLAEYGKSYVEGDIVRHGGERWRATSDTLVAPGLLPGDAGASWEVAR